MVEEMDLAPTIIAAISLAVPILIFGIPIIWNWRKGKKLKINTKNSEK